MGFVVTIGLDTLNFTLALLLVTLGLVVIYGLMNVINMAHGEFFLLGAYCVVLMQERQAVLLVGPICWPPSCLRWWGSPSRNWSSGTFIGASSI